VYRDVNPKPIDFFFDYEGTIVARLDDRDVFRNIVMR